MIKVKKIEKKVKQKTGNDVESLLKNNNSLVLKYIDEIVNDGERNTKIIEIIDYLKNCLLDREVGNNGPKLIDQLNERLQSSQANVKEYSIEDLIWWKGTEAQLEFLFSKLVNENLVESAQFNLRFALLSKHFKNPEGNRYKNKQLSQAVRNLRGKPAPETKRISTIINETVKK